MNEFIKISNLLIAIVGFVFALLVYFKNRKNFPNIIFALLSLSIAGWSFSKFMQLSAGAIDQAQFWAMACNMCACFSPALFLHFCLLTTGRYKFNIIFLRLSYLAALVFFFIAIFATKSFIGVEGKYGFEYFGKAGPLYYPYTVYFFLVSFYSTAFLIFAFKQSTGIKREQIKYIIIAGIAALVGGLSDFPAILWDIYPATLPVLILYPFILTYAGFKYRLMNIGMVIKKSIIYSFLLFTVMAVYLVLLFLIKEVFSAIIRVPEWTIDVTFILLIVFGFRHLEEFFSKITEKVFFRSRTDYQEALKETSRILYSLKDLDKLVDFVTEKLIKLVRVESVSLFLLDEEEKKYKCKKRYPESLKIPRELPAINNPLIDYLKEKNFVIKEELDFMIKEAKDFDLQKNLRIVKNNLEVLNSNLSLSVAVVSNDLVLGILNLGAKRSGDMFARDELDLLSILASQIGISIENIMLVEREKNNAKELAEVQAKSKYMAVLERTNEELKKTNEELKKTQTQLVSNSRLVAVGELAGGVAHEINNPLTGVLGNIQLVKMKGKLKPESKVADYMNLLDIAEKSAIRCGNIVHSLLDFARTKQKKEQLLDLNETVKATTLLIEHMLEVDGIKVEKELCSEAVMVMAHRGRLQQAFLNFINNSHWAIKRKTGDEKSGIIKIITKISEDKQKVEIIFWDNGIGIAEVNLNKVFEPFFTTKHTGESVGLGLSIAWGIIKEHKGNISVESTEGKDTTISVILPLQKES